MYVYINIYIYEPGPRAPTPHGMVPPWVGGPGSYNTYDHMIIHI